MVTPAVTFLDALKSAIEGDSTLAGYIEAVKLVSARALVSEERLAEELPDFDDYAVLIAPRALTVEIMAAGGLKQDNIDVAVVGIARAFNVTGAIDGEGGSERHGILKIRQDLFNLLDRNTLSGSRVLVEDRELLTPAPVEWVLGDHYVRTVVTFKAWLPEYISS